MVRPRRATVSGYMDEPVVRADPNHTFLERRLFDVEDVVVALRSDLLIGDRVAAAPLVLGIVTREILAQHFPTVSTIRRLHDVLRSVVDHIGVVG